MRIETLEHLVDAAVPRRSKSRFDVVRFRKEIVNSSLQTGLRFSCGAVFGVYETSDRYLMLTR